MKEYQKTKKAPTEKAKKYEEQLFLRYRVRSNDRGYCFESASRTAEGGIYLEKRSIRQEQRTRKNLAIKQKIKVWSVRGTKERIVLVQENFHLENDLKDLVHDFDRYTPMYQEEISKHNKKLVETSDIKHQKMSQEMSQVPAKNVAGSDGIYNRIKKAKEDIKEVVKESAPPLLKNPTQKKQPAKCKDNFRRQEILDRKAEIEAVKNSSISTIEAVAGERLTNAEMDELAARYPYELIAKKYKNALITRAKIRIDGNEECGIYAMGLLGLTEYYISEHRRQETAREKAKEAKASPRAVDRTEISKALTPIEQANSWSRQAVMVLNGKVILTNVILSTGIPTRFGEDREVSFDDPLLNDKIQTHLSLVANYLQSENRKGHYLEELACMPKLSRAAPVERHWRNRF